MEVVVLTYTAALGALFGASALWQISRLLTARFGEACVAFARRWLSYTLVTTRQRGSSDLSVGAGVLVVSYGAANIACSVIGISTRAQLAWRLGTLFAVNAVPLYLGGRTSFVLDRVLRYGIADYGLVHRWVGRVCVVEGIVHGVVAMPLQGSRLPALEISLLVLLACCGTASILYLRRRTYELFLKSHLLLVLAILPLACIHAGSRSKLVSICFSLATGLWMLQQLLWLLALAYRNTGSGPSSTAVVRPLPVRTGGVHACHLTITLRRPWKVMPGQYVYVTLPEATRHGLGRLQAHPYMVVWAESDEHGADKTVVLLVERRHGFSSDILGSDRPLEAIVDGPYGGGRSLDRFDKVLFFASGIGIAAHLLSVRHLLEAHEAKTARVRRVSLIWLLETRDQEAWAIDFLKHLLEIDERSGRKILNVLLFLPCDTEGSALRPLDFTEDDRCRRLYRSDMMLDLTFYTRGEWSAEAGSMAVSVCGTPRFEASVRAALRRSGRNIHLVGTDFQPDETSAGEVSTGRYTAKTGQALNYVD